MVLRAGKKLTVAINAQKSGATLCRDIINNDTLL